MEEKKENKFKGYDDRNIDKMWEIIKDKSKNTDYKDVEDNFFDYLARIKKERKTDKDTKK